MNKLRLHLKIWILTISGILVIASCFKDFPEIEFSDDKSSSSSEVSNSSSSADLSSSSVASSSSIAQSSSSACTAANNTAEQYCSNGTMKTYGSVTYGEKKYNTVVIGTQTWMAQNLNYNVSGSLCYGDNSNNCAKYGRLYTWSQAMAGSASSSANPSGRRGICPEDWHIPSVEEWNTLISFVGGSTKLKAIHTWVSDANTVVHAGSDDYGFSALPGGGFGSGSGFGDVERSGNWWSATEKDAEYAWFQTMMNSNSNVKGFTDYKSLGLYSVRCVQDKK